MPTKLIVFRLQRFNIINMFLGMVYLSAENLYSFCPVKLDNKFAVLENSEFVKECNQAFAGEFRDISWSENISWLEYHRSQHQNDLTIGNRSIEQVQWLKNYYSDQCITTCFNYTEDEYPFLLRNVAEYHVHLLDTNTITPNSLDLEYKDATITERVNLYSQEFDKQNLFPKTNNEKSDIVINLRDLVNIDIVADRLMKYGYTMTKQAQNYHAEWYGKNQNFFN